MEKFFLLVFSRGGVVGGLAFRNEQRVGVNYSFQYSNGSFWSIFLTFADYTLFDSGLKIFEKEFFSQLLVRVESFKVTMPNLNLLQT